MKYNNSKARFSIVDKIETVELIYHSEVSGINFSFQLKKENPLSWRLRSSLNIHLAERQQKGVRVKKGLVVIIRLG